MAQNLVLIISSFAGVAIGIFIAAFAFICIRRLCKKDSHIQHHASEHSTSSLPIRMNGIGASIESSVSLANSEIVYDLQHVDKRNTHWSNWGHQDKDLSNSLSSIPRYLYKDIQKATHNFTTVLGQGSFGLVYKATMPTGELVAVKVLASNSRQGEREFQTEVLLLSRLHHRNLVNLVGYCVDKGQRMLIYEYMSNGSLASHLYSEGFHVLSWEERLQIALDVSRGIEYLHEGAVPSVIHRDLKPANILLDRSMTAKVADFGLSKEEVYDGRKSCLKGTYGYMDPVYMTTSHLTKKTDIYAFGLIMFELITAINPQQGLTEYIDLAAMGGEGNADWDEILDKKLVGRCNLQEVGLLADTAYKCLNKHPKKRPSISEVTHAIARIEQRRNFKEDSRVFPGPESLERIEQQQLELSSITTKKYQNTTLPKEPELGAGESGV